MYPYIMHGRYALGFALLRYLGLDPFRKEPLSSSKKTRTRTPSCTPS
jgi:hypothetical protein